MQVRPFSELREMLMEKRQGQVSVDQFGRCIGNIDPHLLEQGSDKRTHKMGNPPAGKEGNLICSTLSSPDGERMHKPVIDIDFPARLIPSSTPGHFHLYLDGVTIPHDMYQYLLKVLAGCGIISDKYAEYSLERGYTAVRRPGEYKFNSPLNPDKRVVDLDDVTPKSEFDEFF